MYLRIGAGSQGQHNVQENARESKRIQHDIQKKMEENTRECKRMEGYPRRRRRLSVVFLHCGTAASSAVAALSGPTATEAMIDMAAHHR